MHRFQKCAMYANVGEVLVSLHERIGRLRFIYIYISLRLIYPAIGGGIDGRQRSGAITSRLALPQSGAGAVAPSQTAPVLRSAGQAASQVRDAAQPRD